MNRLNILYSFGLRLLRYPEFILEYTIQLMSLEVPYWLLVQASCHPLLEKWEPVKIYVLSLRFSCKGLMAVFEKEK